MSPGTHLLGIHAEGQVSGCNFGQIFSWGGQSIDIEVQQVNQVPAANAGADQTVNEESVVQLDGSGSQDPDLEPLSYSWTQIAGRGVSVDLTDPVHPTFLAPTVPAGGALPTLRAAGGRRASDERAGHG